MKRIPLIVFFFVGLVMNSYSSSGKIIFRHDDPSAIRCVRRSGYYFCEDDGIYILSDSCVSVLIEEASKLELKVIPRFTGIDVDCQLILVKEGYGYDVLSICRNIDGSFAAMELNGKYVRATGKWKLLIKYLVEEYKKQPTKDGMRRVGEDRMLDILKKCGMMEKK